MAAIASFRILANDMHRKRLAPIDRAVAGVAIWHIFQVLFTRCDLRILDGANVLTLIIQNVDAPERTFRWIINQ